jgi:hypothetical protein
MKTAMQELESLFYNEAQPTVNTNSWVIHKEAFEKIVLIAKEKEKEQIKDAFKYGWNWNYDAEEYYNQTYNQNK